jgi:hypothetical protein
VVTNDDELRRVAFKLARLSEQLADTANEGARETRGEVAAVAVRMAALAEDLAIVGRGTAVTIGDQISERAGPKSIV